LGRNRGLRIRICEQNFKLFGIKLTPIEPVSDIRVDHESVLVVHDTMGGEELESELILLSALVVEYHLASA
jgi:hypothetical protein